MILYKLATVFQLGGALLALPAGIVGLYSAYQTNFSTEARCGSLRGAILTTLERNVDAQTKRALVHMDLTEFERTCALSDPDAKAVFAALDRSILFTADPDAKASSRPVRFAPPPPPPFGRPGEHPWQQIFEHMRQRPFRT